MHQTYLEHSRRWLAHSLLARKGGRLLAICLVVGATVLPIPAHAGVFMQDEAITSDTVIDFGLLPEPISSLLPQLIAPAPLEGETSDFAAGFMTQAEAQTAIAIQHTGFLQDALADESLDAARQHTEHIVNILDGEDGVLFGDLDQNGQPQNPGDGVGVRVYLAGAEELAQGLADAIDTGLASEEIAASIAGFSAAAQNNILESAKNIEAIQNKAIELLNVDNLDELAPVAQEMVGLVESLAATVSQVNESLNELGDALLATDSPAEASSGDMAQLQAELSEGLATMGAELTNAKAQLDIAIQHTGFLQDAITGASIDEAYQHTEHIVNILDGEDGLLFGDLDQNGQPQNPGDGVGVLVYQATAQVIAQNVATSLADSISNGSSSNDEQLVATQAAGDTLLDAIETSVDTAMAIQAEALSLIGAETIEEVDPIAQNMSSLVEDVVAKIDESISAYDELSILVDTMSTDVADAAADPSANAQLVAALKSAISDDLDGVVLGVENVRGQLGIAIQHTGFLQGEIGNDSIDGVKSHAEHVTNILEGEDGPLYGDLNGDGQTQNPGDGIGVRVHLSDLVPIVIQMQNLLAGNAAEDVRVAKVNNNLIDTLDNVELAIADMVSNDDVATAESLESATELLVELILSDTAEDAAPIADSLQQILVDADAVFGTLETQSLNLKTAIDVDLPAPALDATAFSELTYTAEQLDLALAHVGFLNDELALDNLVGARAHTEHVINILEGQDGKYYGELDGNGAIQNPGDGVGIRVYLERALAAYTELANSADAADFASQLETMQTGLTAIQEELVPTTEAAYKIFAVDSAAEASPFQTEVTEKVTAAAAIMETIRDKRISADVDDADANANADAEADAVVGVIRSSPPYDPSHGDEWTSPHQGGTYVFISGGLTIIGADAGLASSSREQPAHEIDIAGFWIQQTETTNEQFAACVEEGICTKPDNLLWEEADYAKHPVQDVTWSQAMTYAQWAGARLPSEAEWEKACRSGDERLFPWGDEVPDADSPDGAVANINNIVGDAMEVGSYPDGATAEGLLDMSGNVWEWTSTLNRPYPYIALDGREESAASGKRVVRSGSFDFTRYQASCISRTSFDTNAKSIGIRLVLLAREGEWVNPVNRARYIRVESGEFTMGAATGVSPKEEPVHIVDLSEFWIQKTETTNEQYADCVVASDCSPPANNTWADPDSATLPVTNVTLAQAHEYAAYVGGRLPTEAEWEKACRGTDGRLYPWGDDAPDGTLSNFDNIIGEPMVAGSYPGGASAFGLLDMSGNVWEWTSSLDQPYPYAAADGREGVSDENADDKRIMRGGSFYFTRYQVSCTARTGFAPTNQGGEFGFRVVVDSP